MWLGEEMTNRGIGNGVSMIIFIGIISGLPGGIVTLWNLIVTEAGISTVGIVTALVVIIGAILLVAGVVFVQEAERRIPVQYAKKVVGRKMYGGQNTHIPMKLAMAGVMPVIFASSFMTFPAMLIQIFASDKIGGTGFLAGLYKFSIATSTSNGVPWGYSLANALVYLLLIVGFTFFYTLATFNPADVSQNIKQNGGYIPGIRAGKPTTDYLTGILTKLTWFGAIYLSLIAVIPILARFSSIDISFGGTSILIIVGVALETVQQLESLMVMRHYKGFLEK
jgi:preprotein translocase subunit SecY